MTGLFVLFVKPCLERVVLSFVCLFFPSPPKRLGILSVLKNLGKKGERKKSGTRENGCVLIPGGGVNCQPGQEEGPNPE